MRNYLRILLFGFAVHFIAGVILIAFNVSNQYKEQRDFVILADKVGDPTLLTIFRVDPNGQNLRGPGSCLVDGNKLYTPWNVSVFTEAKIGDVLRRFHYTDYYEIFGKVIFQNCYEAFLPVKAVSLYPDMNYWPFRKNDLSQNDPDHDNIFKLTQSQRQ